MSCWVGIDPGLKRTGYAVMNWQPECREPRLLEAGVLRSPSGQSLAERVFELARTFREILLEFRPETVAIELVFSHQKYPRSSLLMCHARGALLFVARDHGLKVHHYAPRQIKHVLTGSGEAPKAQVQQAIQRELGLPQPLTPHDVADATAIALCHFYLTLRKTSSMSHHT